MSPLRFGVIGTGHLGSAHARILSEIPDVELAGIHDADATIGTAVAERIGTTHFGELGALLDRSDAAIVAVTTSAHHAVAGDALDSGCHVLVEKPLTPTIEEADDLIEKADRNGLFLGVGHVERFNPAIRACRPYLKDPRFLACQRLATFQPRGTDVPVMLDLMIHDIDLVLGLVDSEVESVHAIGVPLLTDSVDMANARIVFGNGAVADISASRASAVRARELRLFQPSGYFSLDLAAGRGEYLRRRDDADPAEVFRAGGAPELSLATIVERVPLEAEPAEPLRLELEAFRDVILGRPSDAATARDGRAALEVALRIGHEIERSAHVPV
ncbi:MAG: Gfo/Idh/MocA family oxidoreductase [marine benthic group bacterium]|nr:Gfo/Idh/MocA family oxidoreductase [Gemmatimonadota bacterium]MCL7961756.1 Gfo/Idh/MocA family oxidoreductase [Candidatus Carthagonibacter metallireducens]MCL7973637.1 Gfo/Idh/MocA family oxidoreductase [Gemmatimonadota bacterium]MCL7977472.1 Gfo/Idh/MocA family oxidoreductase [Gemmatimonadota bacterium]MCL7983546.1 Gfo/Idh/MocA family oxidoreductase [Gemmatimonadota bacterium]